MKHSALFSFALLTVLALSLPVFTQSTSRLDSFKKEAVADVEQMKDFSAQMVDQVFSYGELGFLELESFPHPADTLKKKGVPSRGRVSGIAPARIGTLGSGA